MWSVGLKRKGYNTRPCKTVVQQRSYDFFSRFPIVTRAIQKRIQSIEHKQSKCKL